MADDVQVYFADNPWGTVTMIERAPMYVPNLVAAYKKFTKYGRFVTVQGDFAAMRTRQITLTKQILSDPDFSPKSTRQLFRASSSVGGFARKTIDLEYHADEIHWYKDDDLFNFLDTSIEALSRQGLGYLMTLYLDTLYRNAALTSKFAYVTGSGRWALGTSDFSDIGNTDKFDITIVPKLQMGMKFDELVDPEGGPVRLAILCSPGVEYDISETAGNEWKSINAFSEAGRTALLQYGITGVYKGAAFIPTSQNVLWNCGILTAQGPIVEAVNVQDGANAGSDGWDPVQSGAKTYIQLDTAAWATGAFTDLNPGDVVTIHRTRTADHGVTNGVDYREGSAEVRTVLSVDDANKRVTFTKPLFKRGYDTALAGGNFGWVTKAQHIHANIALSAADAIMLGVAQPPIPGEGVPLDTLQKQRRIGWDAWIKAHLMNHEPVRVYYSAGSHAVEGFENIL